MVPVARRVASSERLASPERAVAWQSSPYQPEVGIWVSSISQFGPLPIDSARLRPCQVTGPETPAISWRAEWEACRLLSILGVTVGSGDVGLVATTLELGVGLAAWLGAGQQAAVLAGAANGIGDRAGIPATDYDVTFLGRLVVSARTAAAGTASPPGGSCAALPREDTRPTTGRSGLRAIPARSR